MLTFCIFWSFYLIQFLWDVFLENDIPLEVGWFLIPFHLLCSYAEMCASRVQDLCHFSGGVFLLSDEDETWLSICCAVLVLIHTFLPVTSDFKYSGRVEKTTISPFLSVGTLRIQMGWYRQPWVWDAHCSCSVAVWMVGPVRLWVSSSSSEKPDVCASQWC